jgi:sortase (surface protein transpeptidase)
VALRREEGAPHNSGADTLETVAQRIVAVWLVVLVPLMGACGSGEETSRSGAVAAGSSDENSPASSAGGDGVESFRSARSYEVETRPVRIRIPAIEVSSRLERLGLNADGTIEIPTAWDVAGWFAQGAKPGQPGPAVILGHVDSRAGPAVFYRVRELRSGDEIFVDQRGGDTVEFVVKKLEQTDKNRFPTEDVYFPTLKPMLSLVTCGGTFDTSSGHYRDNIIVFASRVE